MDDKQFGFFKYIMELSDRKKVIALLIIIPVAMYFFYDLYYSERDKSYKQEILDLKKEVIRVDRSKDSVTGLYINAVRTCDARVAKVDSIHNAKYLEYRDQTDKRNLEITQQWRQDYRDAMNQLMKTKKVNEKIKGEISNIKEE